MNRRNTEDFTKNSINITIKRAFLVSKGSLITSISTYEDTEVANLVNPSRSARPLLVTIFEQLSSIGNGSHVHCIGKVLQP